MSTAHTTGPAGTHHVLMLGAGYAGMAAATQLAARTRKADVRVTLVNAHERFTERLRLHLTATGQRVAELDIPTLLADTGAHFVRGWVTAVDAQARTVRIDDSRVLRYDTLVYGLGSVTDTAVVPGVEEHAYTLDGPSDATTLADRLARLGGGTVVVVGGGLTGVESAAEIAERHPELDVVLVGRQDPGARMTARARSHLRAALTRLGVQVISGTAVTKVLPDGVELAGARTIAADVVLWTAGTRVSPLAAAAGLTVDERGRVVTDATLRSVSHPDVYAIGDAAAIRQGYGVLHGTCQSGMPTGVPGPTSRPGRGVGRRLVRGHRHRHLPGRRAARHARRPGRDQRWSGPGVQRCGPRGRHHLPRHRRRWPRHRHPQRGQPRQAPSGRRRHHPPSPDGLSR
ncbi:FAD-dependent oxidoreductase [Micromonospora sp. NPDC085948]|uniref:NAD(P)/FAD-dependent oxidoreductase n=1 Tax=Micromonospora sp. NPDC085948 TaxID=3155293 RepID=UPI003415FAC1